LDSLIEEKTEGRTGRIFDLPFAICHLSFAISCGCAPVSEQQLTGSVK